jgi:hypothetical protein
VIHLALWVASALFLLWIGSRAFALIRAAIRPSWRDTRAPVRNAVAPAGVLASAQSVPTSGLTDATARAIRKVRDAEEREKERLLEVSDDAKRVLAAAQSRRDAAKAAGLDGSLCQFYREVQHYPSWSQRADASRWIKFPQLGPWEGGSEQGQYGPKKKWVAFTMDRMRYTVHLEEYTSGGAGEGDTYGNFELRDSSGTVLLSVGIARGALAEYYEWRPVSIKAYRPGTWAVSFASLQSKARLAEAERYAEERAGTAKLAELKKNFDIK